MSDGSAAVLALAIGLLAASGCGEGNKETQATLAQGQANMSTIASRSRTGGFTSFASPGSYIKRDGDKDPDDTARGRGVINDEVELLATYPIESDRNARHAIESVVEKYYSAAERGDGATACELLYPALAEGLLEAHAISGQGTSKSCGQAASLLFQRQHEQLVADEVATMVVTDVRVDRGNMGIEFLGFKRMPEAEILVERDRHAWKVDSLLDSNVP